MASVVEQYWSSNPEDSGSIPSRKALELHFLQLVPVWVLNFCVFGQNKFAIPSFKMQ